MKRKSNFELLRIISMILIIFHHYAIHGGSIFIEGVTTNRTISLIIFLSGKIGVNLFVLISGYFLIDSKFKFKKLLKLLLQVEFYSLIFLGINYYYNGLTEFKYIIQQLLPLLHAVYWFVTAYVFIYLLMPFLNKGLKAFSKNLFRNMLILLFVLQTIIPTFLDSTEFFNNLVWFIFMYCLGAYIKLYDIKINKFLLLITLIISYAIELWLGYYYMANNSVDAFRVYLLKICEENYLPIFITSISMFLIFKNLNIGEIGIINLLGKSSFAAYLIHDNNLFRSSFWNDVIKAPSYYEVSSQEFILNIFTCVISIFFVAVILETFRIHVLEKILFKPKFIDKISDKVDNFINC